MIERLDPIQVLVVGSHQFGHHAGGAARTAVERFGAIVGQGEGLQGQSSASPTMQDEVIVRQSTRTFLGIAAVRPELLFGRYRRIRS